MEAWEESQHHIDETSEGVNKGKVAEEGNPTRSLFQPLVAKREGHTQPSELQLRGRSFGATA